MATARAERRAPPANPHEALARVVLALERIAAVLEQLASAPPAAPGLNIADVLRELLRSSGRRG